MLRRLLTRKWAPVTVLAVLALAMVGVTLAQREGGGGSGLLGTAVGDTFTADSNPKTVRLGNGDIVLTARKTADKKAWMATYSAATAVWGDWSEVGAVGSGTAIMDTWTDSEWQMVFALKGDGNVNYRQYKNKVWGAWANLGTAGGGQVGDPAAAGARPGCTQWAMMAIRGKDTNFWLQSQCLEPVQRLVVRRTAAVSVGRGAGPGHEGMRQHDPVRP
ncbi:MAG: hypothetical protein NTZ05_22055 [Chloroflexi bacterium]|nr:hypothetical protein [Chloroflexota bacterium]